MLHKLRPAILIIGLPALIAAACGKDAAPPPGDDAATEGSGGAGGDGGSGGAAAGTGGAGAPGGTGGSVGSDGGGAYDAAPVPATVALNESPAAFASLLCEKLYTCCSAADQARLVLSGVSGQANCEQTFTSLLTGSANDIMAALGANRVTYDGTALGTCLREYQGASCDVARPKGTVISHRECTFLTPLVEIGGTCQRSFECKAGYCAQAKCAAKKAEGQPCGDEDECVGRCSAQAPRTCVAAVPDLCAAF
jgi:hypothetical protein